jgi:hypothetical protein
VTDEGTLAVARRRLQLRQPHLVWLIALAIGGAVFLLWLGYAPTLDPQDLTWISTPDSFTHAIGWEQFRHAPLVQYPITRNELYGLEWSSTIVYSDSIPIAALVLRPLSAVLPYPFQYLGWWALMSVILQAYWGAKLALLRSDRLRDAAIAAAIFATAPVMIERVGFQTALGSTWLVLWALHKYLASRDAALVSWAGLLLLSVSVHAYLFVMVGGIWIAHLVSCRMRGQLARRELALAGATPIVVAAWMHALGYFVVGQGAVVGGWRSNFDLLGFVAPSPGARLGVLPAAYGSVFDGSEYLGLGVVLLLIASAVAYVVRRRRSSLPRPVPGGPSWTPLVVILVGFAACAITNQVMVANRVVVALPLPHVVDVAYQALRGAQRLMWPTYYLVVAATLWLAFRAWPRRARVPVLVAAAAVQLVDLHGVAALRRDAIEGPGMTRRLDDPIWATVAQHYRRLVSVPSKYWQADWMTLAEFSARNRLGCNLAYTSRTDHVARLAGARAYVRSVVEGTYDPDTVYYFPSSALWNVARRTMDPRGLAIVADGLHLLLPGGRAWVARTDPPPSGGSPLLGTWISFADPDSDGLLLDNFWWRESWGTWSGVGASWMVLPVPPHERVRVTFKWMSSAPIGTAQPVRVHLDDLTFDVRLPRPEVSRLQSFEVTTSSRLLDVRFEVAGSRPPRPNERSIGLGLIAARVQRAADAIDDDVPAAARAAPILDTWIGFAANAPGRSFLGPGWSWGEPWGTWSDDYQPVLALPVPPGQRLEVSLRWFATAPPGQAQAARVYIDDRPFDVKLAATDQAQDSSFEVTSQRGWIVIRVDIARPLASNGRLLGIGLTAARVRLSSAAPPP